MKTISCRRISWIVAIIGAGCLSGCTTMSMPGRSSGTQEPDDMLRAPIRTGYQKATQPLNDLAERLVEAAEPSHHRDWRPNLAMLPFAEVQGDRVIVRNIRNTRYRTADDYTVSYYDKEFDLNKIRSMDVFIVPFGPNPTLAHVAMSFGFEGGDFLGVSVEVRKESDESYDPVLGAARQFELIYVLADERDMIRLSTDHMLSDVYLYPLNVTPAQARVAFLDVMGRVNRLIEQPEFYHTLANNCTTNVVEHINVMLDDTRKLPHNYQVVLPGLLDQLLYQRGLIATNMPFARAKLAARINPKAYIAGDDPNFSTLIRR